MINYFLSCDWGTSSFRLRLIEVGSNQIVAEIKSGQGIAETHRLWKDQEQMLDREAFYTQVIAAQLSILSNRAEVKQRGIDLSGIPVVLSGMASSTIGLIDIPYKAVPFSLDGSDLHIKVLKEHTPDNPLIIISGACTEQDVMRGEETKILGCMAHLEHADQALQLLLPGTHPKHVRLENGKVQGFKTYMTGEFFNLLAGQSVLSGSVAAGGDLDDAMCLQHFIEGLQAAVRGELLHSSFMVRTRQVLQQVSPQHNYYYLSGLLIGTELKDVKSDCPVYLLSSGVHTLLYTKACEVLGIEIKRVIEADEALVKGQEMVLGFALA